MLSPRRPAGAFLLFEDHLPHHRLPVLPRQAGPAGGRALRGRRGTDGPARPTRRPGGAARGGRPQLHGHDPGHRGAATDTDDGLRPVSQEITNDPRRGGEPAPSTDERGVPSLLARRSPVRVGPAVAGPGSGAPDPGSALIRRSTVRGARHGRCCHISIVGRSRSRGQATAGGAARRHSHSRLASWRAGHEHRDRPRQGPGRRQRGG
jgi:hypothetical protein